MKPGDLYAAKSDIVCSNDPRVLPGGEPILYLRREMMCRVKEFRSCSFKIFFLYRGKIGHVKCNLHWFDLVFRKL